jgi:hypothetical protein
MTEFEMMQFYDDMHSHFYEHSHANYPGCKMCDLVYNYRFHRTLPREWNPPRKEGRPDSDKIDEYIKGLQEPTA